MRLIQGQRRSQERSGAMDSDSNRHWLHVGEKSIPCQLVGSDFGRLTIATHAKDAEELSSEVFTLVLTADENTVASGEWRLLSKRMEDGCTILSLETVYFEKIAFLKTLYEPAVFFRKNHYKVIGLDSPEYLAHLTEIKDSAMGVSIKLSFGDLSLPLKFDFSSNQKTLNGLEFVSGESLLDLPVGEEVTISYSFIGVRFLFQSKIAEVDKDFNLIKIELPSDIVTVLSRRFDRMAILPEHSPGVIKYRGEEIACRIHDVNSTAVRFEAEVKFDGGTELKLEHLSTGRKISISGTAHGVGTVTYLKVKKEQTNLNQLAALIMTTIRHPVVVRTRDHYESLLALYKGCGYAPASDGERWKQVSFGCWDQLDERFPLNVTAAYDVNELVASTGCMPITSNVAYQHSVCLIKSLISASLMYKQLTLTTTISDLYKGIEYLSGAYKTQSKFSTRLHMAFEYTSGPERQSIIHARMVNLTPYRENSAALGNFKVELKKIEPHQAKQLPESLQLLLGFGFEPDRMIETSAYSLGIDGELGVIAEVTAPEGHTAANVFRRIWIFLNGTKVDLPSLLQQLAVRFPDAHQAQLVERDIDREGYLENFVPIFWSVTHKEDYHLVQVSAARCVYSIIRKYGPEAEIYLREIA